MGRFTATYRDFVRNARKTDRYFAFDMRALARLEPVLGFLYQDWWKVDFSGLDLLPEKGPAVIACNSHGFVPWAALMLIYALMADQRNPRRINILFESKWMEDERAHALLAELGFVPWSSANVKKLIARDELIAIFPEGVSAIGKPFEDRYRLNEFDWTMFMPAVEEGIKIFPLSVLGCDEAVPTFANWKGLAKMLDVPAFPVTPFFPWLPFPLNLMSLPVPWKMRLLAPQEYDRPQDREELEEVSKQQAEFAEGTIQSELNRALRTRHKG